MAKLSSAELSKRKEIIQGMLKNKRTLVKRYIKDKKKKGEEPINPEAIIYGRATNIAKKVAETQMKNLNLKELVRAALMNEKAGFTDEFDNDPALKGGQKNLPDGLQKAIISKAKGKLKEGPKDMYWSEYVKSLVNDIRINGLKSNERDYTTFSEDDFVADYEDYILNQRMDEDLDLGHEDNEPHMIKAELYRIGKYAMELYQMVDQFEGEGEVDFPAWWQAKITTAKNMVSSAKHYLEFELKEPEIDAMVGVAAAEDIIPNVPTKPLEDELEEGLPKGFWDKKMKAKDETNESYETLVKKIKGQGESTKAAKAIAGTVAAYKAKGGGKGPTAKQKARG